MGWVGLLGARGKWASSVETRVRSRLATTNRRRRAAGAAQARLRCGSDPTLINAMEASAFAKRRMPMKDRIRQVDLLGGSVAVSSKCCPEARLPELDLTPA